MTARFGRNKRRAAREALAAANTLADHLQTRLTYADNSLRDVAQKLAVQRAIVDEIVERLIFALGVDSAIIPWSLQRNRYDLDFIPNCWEVTPRVMHAYAGARAIDVSAAFGLRVDLVQLVLRLEQDPIQYRRIIRILVKHPLYDGTEGEAAILVDAETFRKRGVSPHDVDLMFDMYRHQLREFIADGGMRPKVRGAARG